MDNLILEKSSESIVQLVEMKQQVDCLIPNWDLVPVGTKFKGYIESVYVEGRIQIVDGEILLCQDKKNGKGAEDQLGFKYAWTIDDGDAKKIRENNVIITDLELDPHFIPRPIWKGSKVAGYTPKFHKGIVKFGCQEVSNDTIRKIAAMLMD